MTIDLIFSRKFTRRADRQTDNYIVVATITNSYRVSSACVWQRRYLPNVANYVISFHSGSGIILRFISVRIGVGERMSEVVWGYTLRHNSDYFVFYLNISYDSKPVSRNVVSYLCFFIIVFCVVVDNKFKYFLLLDWLGLPRIPWNKFSWHFSFLQSYLIILLKLKFTEYHFVVDIKDSEI